MINKEFFLTWQDAYNILLSEKTDYQTIYIHHDPRRVKNEYRRDRC